MRRYLTVPVLISVLFMSGCNFKNWTATPAKRYASTLVAFDTMNKTFLAANKAHKLSDQEIDDLGKIYEVALKQKKIMQDDFRNNAAFNETAIKSANNAIDAVLAYLASKEKT